MSNQLEFRHLKYFLAVTEDLHFRKAAERLYISQPGLSRQVKQMEDDLEVKFIELKNVSQRTRLRVVWNKENRNPVLGNILDVVKRNFDTEID